MAASKASVGVYVGNSVRIRMPWLGAKLAARRPPCRAQIVTCTSGQIQTTVTISGSDIIRYGLAGSDDGVIIAMASRRGKEPRIS